MPRGGTRLRGAVGIEAVGAARERERHAVPLIGRLVGHDRDDRGRRRRRAARWIAAQPGAQRGCIARTGTLHRLLRRRVADHEHTILERETVDAVSGRDGHRRVDAGRDDRVGHDVAAHAQRLAAERDRAARRHAESLERKELEVGAVVARRQKSRFPGALGDPRRRGHLVERAAFAAAHGVAGQREEIRLEVGLADLVDRVLHSRAAGAKGGDRERDGEKTFDHTRLCLITRSTMIGYRWPRSFPIPGGSRAFAPRRRSRRG